MVKKIFIIFICFFSLGWLVDSPVLALMGSQNYRIPDDSLNIGGIGQGSANYRSEDTIGEAGTGEMASSNYNLRAGFQQMNEIYLSLSAPTSNLALNQPSAMSLSVNTASNAASGAAWNVKTDAPAGYVLSLKTDQANTLRDAASGSVFTDYTEATSGVPDTWNVNSGSYEFGFSVFGNDVSTATWGTGSNCTTPASNNLKYQGFKGVTAIQVASANSNTTSSGTDTKFCVAAEQNSVFAPSGSFTANITATAVSQ